MQFLEVWLLQWIIIVNCSSAAQFDLLYNFWTFLCLHSRLRSKKCESWRGGVYGGMCEPTNDRVSCCYVCGHDPFPLAGTSKYLSLSLWGNCLAVSQGCGNLSNLYLHSWSAASCHWALNSLHLCVTIAFLACERFAVASETLSMSSCDKKLLAYL